jgi:hypothetical protein
MNLKCVSIRNNQWYIHIANIIADADCEKGKDVDFDFGKNT